MRRRIGFRLAAVLAAALAVSGLAACTAAGDEEGAVLRGDEAFARGDHAEALAEYRLALRQGPGTVETLTRAAHAFARVGRIDEAREHYQMAIALDPDVADLAASDLLRMAAAATNRGDGIAAAAAVEAALELKPGVSLTGLALPLARHFARNGQFGQALPYFQKAIVEVGGDPQVLFEMALAHEELGDCGRAVVFLDQVRDEVSVAQRSTVDWHMGNCSFDLGMDAVQEEDWGEALQHFQAMLAIGEPRNRLAQAWFETGELLARAGRCSEAVDAFDRAQRDELAGSFLVQRARLRIDEIRFRRGGDGPC